MAKWIEYTGSDEQIDEINNAEKYITRLDKNRRTQYLICEPHPYDDIIKIWADTGCEVWIKTKGIGFRPCEFGGDEMFEKDVIYETNKPDWNIPGAEYRLTQFDESKK